jgi:hypothetical protein
MPAGQTLARSLRDAKELQTFAHDLIKELVRREVRPRRGEDVARYAKEARIAIPRSLRGVKMTWDPRQDFGGAEGGRDSVLVLVGPGHLDALGFTIGCIRIGRIQICLECGWLYCRIVIKGRF